MSGVRFEGAGVETVSTNSPYSGDPRTLKKACGHLWWGSEPWPEHMQIRCIRTIPEGWKGHSGRHLGVESGGGRIEWWKGSGS